MNETKRLQSLIREHFDGSPWLDVNIINTVDDVTADEASKKIGDHNSIYQIVVHMSKWRTALLKKLMGEKIVVPSNNFIEKKSAATKKEWKLAVKDLKDSQKKIVSFLSVSKDERFDTEFSNGHNYYEHIQAILLHDTYHLGQIVLLKKLINN